MRARARVAAALLLALGATGCLSAPAGRRGGLPPSEDLPRDEAELRRLEGELGALSAAPGPRRESDRVHACDLANQICALANRICALAAQDPAGPSGPLAAYCRDGEARCARATRLSRERHGCHPPNSILQEPAAPPPPAPPQPPR